MVIVIARFRPRPERQEEFLALLADVQEASRRDDGCINYGYYANVTDPASCVAVEEWADMGALEAHLRTPHVGRLLAAIGEMGELQDIAAHDVASSGPLPLPA